MRYLILAGFLAACGGETGTTPAGTGGRPIREAGARDAFVDVAEEPPDCSLIDAPPGLGVKIDTVCDTPVNMPAGCHLRCVTYVLPRDASIGSMCKPVCSVGTSCVSPDNCKRERCCSSCDSGVSVCEPWDGGF